MQSLEWGLQSEPENVLCTQVGHFWGIVETRDYCRARYRLYEAIADDFAYWGEQAEQWEIALGHLLEIMRLNRSDNMGLRDKVVVTHATFVYTRHWHSATHARVWWEK